MTDDRTPAEKLEAQGFRRGEDFVVVGDIFDEQERTERHSRSPEEGAGIGLTAPGLFVLARLEGYSQEPFEPGIYFGMPEEIYHAAPALSSHGIKDIAASPMVYWDRCRWMNPDWQEREEKAHLTLGKAYECRILEGPEVFAAQFAAAADRKDYPDAFVTLKNIETRLEEYGLKCPRNKADAIAKLREFDPDAQLWEQIEAEHNEKIAGKKMITAADMRRIEIANRIVQLSEEQAAVINQGHAQVSLFWTCRKTGVPMKARADKLLIRAIVDMKTIGNIDGSFEVWIPRTVANYRYNLQPSVYFEACDEVRKIVRERGNDAIHSCDIEEVETARGPELYIEDQELHSQRCQWAKKWASNVAPDEWLWLFVGTKPPITRLVHYPRGGTTKMVTDEIVSRMKRRFREMTETYGVLPWLDLAPRIDLADEDIPKWSTEI